MEDLIDIQGLDYISWWPLALGWWILIAIVLISVGSTVFFVVRKIKYQRSWQYKAYKRLASMQTDIGAADSKQVLQNLSIEIRKIAMLTTKRESCAGLIGPKWLEWLQQHDPTGFAWQENGGLLISAQYMPNSATDNPEQISKLIAAAQGWVKKC
jgi:hypothetical protein